MMEDAGEDVLRAKPNMVVTFFKRLGQVTARLLNNGKLNLNYWSLGGFLSTILEDIYLGLNI